MRIANWMGLVGLVGIAAARGQGTPDGDYKFSFGPGQPIPGYTQVLADTLYTKDRGFGFEANTAIPAPGTGPAVPVVAPTLQAVERGGDGLHGQFITSDKQFLFSVALLPGNYRVIMTLGDAAGPSTTTVKAESRALMLEHVQTEAGQFVSKSFAINLRSTKLPDGTPLKLDAREQGVFHWDDKLTLEFCDARPAVCAVEIHKVDDAVTVFLCGDSTVTTQVREPYGTWGQMLPRWFNDRVAVANYAESGETLKAFKKERRWDKVLAEMKKGDYVFMQFGHNDLNQRGHNGIWPADDKDGDWANTYSDADTDYKRLLKEYAGEVKEHGGVPVIVSPMTKIQINTGELNIAGLKTYPQAAVSAAAEAGVSCIDLNAMSIDIVKGLGPELARRAYVEGLHSNSYGGYLFARAVVEGIRKNKLDLARFIVEDAGSFDPAHPTPLPDEFRVPLEPGGTGLGRGRRAGPATAPATMGADMATSAPAAGGR